MPSTPRRRSTLAATLALMLSVPTLMLSAATASADSDDANSTAPRDILGRSAASTVLRGDDLAISATDSSGATTALFSSPNADLSEPASQGQPVATTARRSLSFPSLQSRSARLMDSQSDRVLALQKVAVGTGASWQVSSPNGSMESADGQSKNTDNPATVSAGQTFAFKQLAGNGGLSAATDSGDAHTQLSVADSDETSMAQQWSLRAASDGHFRLVNRSDGFCLNVLDNNTDQGAAVGAWPCPDGNAAQNEEWIVQPDYGNGNDNPPSSYRLYNSAAGRYLTVSDQGLLELGTQNSEPTDDEGWTLTQIYDDASEAISQKAVPTWSTPASSQDGMPAALATGDLDRAVGTNGQYADEAAVAYVDDNHQLQVRVLNYNTTSDHFLVSAPDTTLPKVGSTVAGTWYPGSVGIAVGNFNGVTQDSSGADVQSNQLAVTWQDADGFHASFLGYSSPALGSADLTVLASDVPLPRSSASQSSKPVVTALAGMSTTAVGDFNSDDVDDLALSYAGSDSVNSSGSYSGTTGWLKIVNFNTDFSVNTNADQQLDSNTLALPQAGQIYTNRGVSLTPALFDLGSSNADFGSRQVVAAWTTADPTFTYVKVAKLDSSDSVAFLGPRTWTEKYESDPTDHPMSIAAGGLKGWGPDGSVPTWGIALAFGHSVTLIQADAGDNLQMTEYYSVPSGDLSVATFDRTGRSLLLGAPAVLTLDQSVAPFLIAAQPPTHADWLPDSNGSGKFVNVSRNGEFIVDMGSGSSSTTTSTHTRKSSTSLGISESADSKTTVKGGLGSLESASETAEISQQFAKESAKDNENTSENTSSKTIKTSQSTAGDDVVDAVTEVNTVYRYPILNGPVTGTDGTPLTSKEWCPTTCHGFYEVTVAGKATETEGGGKADSWYQPDWQNGNALSYPALVNQDLKLNDQGSYSYTDPSTGKTTQSNSDIADTGVIQLGADPFTTSMTTEDGATAGVTRTTSGSLSNSQEVKSSTKVHGSIGAASVGEDVDISAGVQENSTWADTKSSTNTVTSSSTFKLEAPPLIVDEAAYNVQTKYYVDQAGTPKVVHGVDLTSNQEGSRWWQKNYTKADLALNLNTSITMTPDAKGDPTVPQWTADSSRQRIRGFSALQADDPNNPVTSNQPYANNPAPGDSVRFAVRVHNYSLSSAPASTAQFYAVPVTTNDDGSQTLGDPTPIGNAVGTPNLDPQGVTTVTSNPWTAVAPNDGSGSEDWRIFVVLDPDGTIDETHPWKGGAPCPEASIAQNEGETVTQLTDPMTGQPETLACGQNNQGFGEVTVTAPSSQQAVASATAKLKGARGLQKATASQPSVGRMALTREDEDYLTLDRTTLFTAQNIPVPTRHGIPRVIKEEPVQGVVHASSAITSSEQQNVLVWDGAPGKGVLIAHARMAGADAIRGGTARFTWTPSKPGRHTLTTVLLTTYGPDKVQKTTVDVKPHGRATGLSVLPSQTTTAPGVPVRFTTSTIDIHGNQVKDVTRTTRLTISPDGSCRKTRCSAEIAGDHVVTAQHAGFVATAAMAVAKGKLAVTPTYGPGQQVKAKQTFAPLVASATDETGKALDRVPVRFEVTSGHASFSRGRQAATVRTGPAGVVQAPRLTAGSKSGAVVVTATSGDTSAVYALTVVKSGRDRADLALKFSGAGSAKAGSTVKTKVHVVNRGPKTASSTLVEITTPPGSTLTKTPDGSRAGRTVLYRLGSLKHGKSRTLELSWTGSPGQSRLEAVAVSATTDPRETNNHATQVVTLTS